MSLCMGAVGIVFLVVTMVPADAKLLIDAVEHGGVSITPGKGLRTERK